MATTNVRGGQIKDASVDLTVDVTGTLPAANGGTGNATNTANSIMVGNGTSALTGLAPGTSGNVAKSNGTTWTSAAATVDVPVWIEIPATYGTRAAGYMTNTLGFMAPAAFTLTGVIFRGETADSSAGTHSSTFELRQNGSQVSGTSKAIDYLQQWTYDTDIYVSGLSVAIAAGDVLRPYCSTLTTGVPGNGFSAVVIGTVSKSVI